MKQFPALDGRYQVVQKLSAGGFGVTYLAKDMRRPGHPLCVAKELRHEHQSNPKILQLFHQEAEMLEHLGEHSQIPKLLAAFSEANRWYLIQEYIDGTTLADELVAPTGQRLQKAESEVINILRDVLRALAFVHQNNVVHRDIKPANLIRRKKDGKMVVIDFGAVKELTVSQINQQGTVTVSVCVISRGYTPCEQFQGKVSAASDIYALGVTAIEALTGQCPQSLEPESVLAEWQWRQYAQVSDSLAAFLSKMVRVERRHRFQNAGAALSALESFARQKPLILEPTQLPPSIVQENNQTSTSASSQTIPSRPPSQASEQRAIAPTVASNHKNRRDVLKFMGFAAVGVSATLFTRQFIRDSSRDSELITSAVEPNPAPVPQPTSSPEPTPTPTPEPSALLEVTPQLIRRWDLETIKVNSRGRIVATPAVQVKYFDEPFLLDKLGDALPLRMVKIPAGEFTIGAPPDEQERRDDEKQQQVSLSSFFIGAFEVTQRQYLEVMNNNPSKFSKDGADLPVERVSWLDAEAFCEKLSNMTGNRYRLPSEKEWEYACRARTTTPFAFGEAITMEIVNFNWYSVSEEGAYRGDLVGTYKKQTIAVNALYPNAFGLYNMHGNVNEWCGGDYLPYDTNDYDLEAGWGFAIMGKDGQIPKAARGGRWSSPPVLCRSACRYAQPKGSSDETLGFRVVCELAF